MFFLEKVPDINFIWQPSKYIRPQNYTFLDLTRSMARNFSQAIKGLSGNSICRLNLGNNTEINHCHQESNGLPEGRWSVKIYLPMQETQETWVRSLGQEYPLKEEMATHSSIPAWKIPWTGGLQSIGSKRVRWLIARVHMHTHTHTHTHPKKVTPPHPRQKKVMGGNFKSTFSISGLWLHRII